MKIQEGHELSIEEVRDAQASREGALAQRMLIFIGLFFLGVIVVAPLCAVFFHALSHGAKAYFDALKTPETLAAFKLSLLTVLIAVPLNTIFGIAAAWLIAHYEFKGRRVLLTLIEIPLAVSPVIAGMVFVLTFGTNGLFGPWLKAADMKIIFAVPGIILVTTFITVPYVARELIPLMQEQGAEEELAALTMGASGWQMFCKVTLPKISWGLLYGIILCNARALGEFGAVSVVSGHIRGKTNTLPLHIEVLYNEYNFTAAFAVASLLTILALLTLICKSFVEWNFERA